MVDLISIVNGYICQNCTNMRKKSKSSTKTPTQDLQKDLLYQATHICLTKLNQNIKDWCSQDDLSFLGEKNNIIDIATKLIKLSKMLNEESKIPFFTESLSITSVDKEILMNFCDTIEEKKHINIDL